LLFVDPLLHNSAKYARFYVAGNSPQCGTRAKEAWLQGRLAQVLNVPYAHMVFTLPHSLNALYGAHPRWVIDAVFACAAQTLSEFAANPKWLGGQAAFTLVLHTWGQELQRHIHVHALVACGALADNGQWVRPTRSPEFLLPVHALSRVFRGKFMAALQQAHEAGEIANDPQRSNPDWAKRHRALYQHSWVVYAKTPMGGPAQVLEYLARYTHRTAISNERVVSVGTDQVAFKVRADEAGGKRIVRLAGVEFVHRFLLHVLPTGLKRIRSKARGRHDSSECMDWRGVWCGWFAPPGGAVCQTACKAGFRGVAAKSCPGLLLRKRDSPTAIVGKAPKRCPGP
jgi:hypothetical protein